MKVFCAKDEMPLTLHRLSELFSLLSFRYPLLMAILTFRLKSYPALPIWLAIGDPQLLKLYQS